MKILIVTAEMRLAQDIRRYLEQEDNLCELTADINEGRSLIGQFSYECILLDLSFQGEDGLRLLQDLRRGKGSDRVIVISAKNSLEDKVMALKAGADDYLSKPFHLAELSARIEAVTRSRFLKAATHIVFQQLKIDTASRAVYVADRDICLTKTEYELLLFLIINKGKVIAKNTIAEHLNGQSAIHPESYDIIYAHIKNLKRKLVSEGYRIKSVYGSGYKFIACV
ncbi:response regulator transcription factor [Chitinophaga sancti]|uniref:response regulator transcription factor n=1 Tax=Chitinophaga sancti TaxID=1004 RepID=UPI003F7A781B